jgi:hypothetical protein
MPLSRPTLLLLLLLVLFGAGQTQAQDVDAAVEEPTEEQIRDAYAAAIADINARTVAAVGAADAGRLNMALEDLKKLGCRSLGRAGVHYDCRVERRIRRGQARPATDVVQLWLAYEGADWVVR